MRHRFTLEQLFLILTLAVVSSLMAGQIWGTAYTCDDDLYAATAWQQVGAPAPGWSAIFTVSRQAAEQTGRFYQWLLYAIWQLPYLSGSFALPNAILIASMLLVFASFAAMLASITRDLSFGLYCAILCAAMIEAKYNYNGFHAYPLWFSFGLAILFLTVLLFQEGLLRAKRRWILSAGILYFLSLLFYEAILFYSIIFFLLAYAHDRKPARIFPNVWPIAASAALYLLIYAGFKHAHPGNYEGALVSSAGIKEIATTIAGFSITGLNYHGLLQIHRHFEPLPMLAAVLVLAAAFLFLRRLATTNRLLPVAAIAALCMFFPNLLQGYTEKYRFWYSHYGDFDMGSFYSSFGEVIVLAAISIFLVRVASRLRLKSLAAAGLAAFFALAAYSNLSQTIAYFQVHRDNRKLWDLVENSIASTGGPRQAAVIISPDLTEIRQLNVGMYKYWDFYFTRKLQRPVHVIGKLSEFRALPPAAKSGPVFGYACRYFPESHAGLYAFGPIDLDLWKDQGLLIARPVQTGVLGGRNLSVFDHSQKVTGAQPVDLGDLSLRP